MRNDKHGRAEPTVAGDRRAMCRQQEVIEYLKEENRFLRETLGNLTDDGEHWEHVYDPFGLPMGDTDSDGDPAGASRLT